MKIVLTAFLSTFFHIIIPVFANLQSNGSNEAQLASTTAKVVIEKAYVFKSIVASGVLAPKTKKQIKNPSTTKALESNIATQDMGIKPRTVPITLRPSASKTAVPTTAMPTSPPTLFSQDISYHDNKTVMTGPVNLYNTYVGEFSSLNDPAAVLVNYFSSNVGNSSWFGILPKYYYQIQNGVKTYISKNGLKYKKGVLSQSPLSSFTSIRSFAQLIVSQFNLGTLPVDQNAIYTIVFRGNLPSFSDPASGSWIDDWCGIHASFALNNINGNFKFAVIGDPAYKNAVDGYRCQASSSPPNGNMGADSIINIFAHELAETLTNPNPLTWYINNADRDEPADACGWTFGTYMGNWNVIAGAKRFLIQQLWVPGRGCALSG